MKPKKIIVNTVLVIFYCLLTLLSVGFIHEYYGVLNDELDFNSYDFIKGDFETKELYLKKMRFPSIFFAALSVISWITYFTRRQRGNIKYFYVILALVVLYFFMF